MTYSVPRVWLLDPARVWPVEIDPNLFTHNPTDTYISEGYPNTCYGTSEELWSGKWDTQSDVCKTLVKFPQLDNENSLPDGAHISSATFSIRQFWQPDTNHDLTHVYRVGVGSTLWGEAGTWNTITITDSVLLGDVAVAGAAWLDLDVTGSVQYWADRADNYNKGFVIRRVAGEDSSYRRKFRSGEYANADYRPKLTVDWEEPTVAVTPSTTAASVGETVTATLALGQEAAPYTLYDPSQVSSVKLGINRTDADASRRRGVFAWFAEVPSGAGWVYERARNASAEPDGYFAYYASTAYGSDKVTPLLEQCVVADDHESVSFAFAPEDDWGSPDDNQLDTYLDLTAGSSLWSSGWVSQSSPTFDVAQDAGVPEALSSLTATTSASAGWFAGVTNDSADQGRGSATLSWPAVPLADSYKVYLDPGR